MGVDAKIRYPAALYEKNKEEFKDLYRRQVGLQSSSQADSKKTSSQKLSTLSSTKAVTFTNSSKTTEKTTSTKKTDWAALQKSSLEYGKNSESDALRRAEVAANTYSKNHGIVPYDMNDDICKKVADVHMRPYLGDDNTKRRDLESSRFRHNKVTKLETDLKKLTVQTMRLHQSNRYCNRETQIAVAAIADNCHGCWVRGRKL